MLLRGADEYGHWGTDPDPRHDLDPVCIEAMESTRAKFMKTTETKIASGGRS